MQFLEPTMRPFPRLLVLSLFLIVIGCTSETKNSDSSSHHVVETAPSDPRAAESGVGIAPSHSTRAIPIVETMSPVRFRDWTLHPHVHLYCSPNYRVVPSKVDEGTIDGFSSMPSLDQIAINLVFSMAKHKISMPIQIGLSETIVYSPGTTLLMKSSAVYRSKTTCGRISITRTGSDAEEIFFSTWTGKDSVGVSFHKADGSLVWGGASTQSFSESDLTQSSEGNRGKGTESLSAHVLQTDDKWLFEIDGRGYVTLNHLLPMGKWRLRHNSVMYADYPLVIEYTCNPYDEDNDFCGFPSQDGRLMADPPSPVRIHFAIKVSTRGDSLTVKPVWEENAGEYVLSQLTSLDIGEDTKLPLSKK